MALNRPALEQLARVVTTIPAGKLDMATYGKPNDHSSAACLATWAARDAWFAKRGYHVSTYSRPPNDEGERYYNVPTCNDHFGPAATRVFFGISQEQESKLFGSSPRKPKIPLVLEYISTVLLPSSTDDGPEPEAA